MIRTPWPVVHLCLAGALLAPPLVSPLQRPAPPPAGVPAQAPPPQKGSALVLGQVVDALTGAPIANATVTVTSRIPIASFVLLSGHVGPAEFLTATDGRFVLHDLPKTNLQINVVASGYVNAAFGQSRPNGSSRPLEVDEGQRLGDVKVRMWKYGVITGTVLDDVGEPAVGLAVRAVRRSLSNGLPAISQSGLANTDDRGVYRLSGLTPGDYLVTVPQSIETAPAAMLDAMLQSLSTGMPQAGGLADLAVSAGGRGAMRVGDLMVTSQSGFLPMLADGRVMAYQTLFYPAAVSPAQAEVVTVASGDERSGIDFQLRVVPTFRVSGSVTTPTGSASGIAVHLLAAGAEDATGPMGADIDVATATTGSDGAFTFLGVPPGRYVARAARQPRPPLPAELAESPIAQLAFGPASSGPSVALYAKTSVGVNATDVTGVALALAEGAKLSGRVQFDGTATPPTPQQIQGITVTLTAIDGNGDTTPTPARVGQGGQFKTLGYPPGRFYLTPSPRVGAWTLKSVMAGGRDILNGPLELADADVGDVVVTYTDAVTQISGTVHLPATGTPPYVTVLLFPADYRAWAAGGMSPRLARSASASKTGTFTIGAVPAGEFLVAALDDADVPENEDVAFYDALAPVATRVVLHDGDKPSVNLEIVKVKR